MGDKVVVLDHWPSAFGVRVHVALAEKGIEYETKEEDLFNKSQLLLEMNPVHKKIPVLLHNAKPICESLIILQYIDEVWSHGSPLLPSDPYQRSQAKFWADFVDKKIYPVARNIWKTKGEEQEAAKKEYIESWKTLEEELGDKPFFGGECFGFVDIALVPFTGWFYFLAKMGDIDTEAECPKIAAWAKRCWQRESVSKSLPDHVKVYDYVLGLNKRLGTN